MDKEESTVEIQQRKIEQRRFILWSIARANAPVPRGPHFEGFRPEVVAPNVTTTPVQSVEVRPVEVRRLRKGPRYYRGLLISSATTIGASCGALIGLNVGLAFCSSTNNVMQGALCLVTSIAISTAIGALAAREQVLRKRADLFGRRLVWCTLCPSMNRSKLAVRYLDTQYREAKDL